MSCSSSTPGFPTAATMSQMSANYPVIWDEISLIQQAILAAISQCTPQGGQLSTVVAGTTPMTFISGVSSVTVTAPGFGYLIDTPSVKFIPPRGSSATGANGTVTTNGGAIVGVTVTAGGTGYSPIPSTLAVSSVAGTGATLQPLVNATGNIVSINIVAGGADYTVNDTIVATRAVAPDVLYVDAVFRIASVSVTGQIIAIDIVNRGSGYQDSVATATIVSTLTPALPYPYGAGFSGTVIVDNAGVITGVAITNVGAAYVNATPYLVISNAGTGATTQVNLSSSTVSSISVTKPGTGYSLPITGVVFNPVTAPAPNPPISPATVSISVNQNTYGTDPGLYYRVWANLATNPVIQAQMASVISYFTNLGYTIQQQSNPAAANVMQWYIAWNA